jgi:hypothetical protein
MRLAIRDDEHPDPPEGCSSARPGQVQELTRDYPAFEFRSVPTWRGSALLACRRAGVRVTGLYVIITKDEDEMRRELAGFKPDAARGEVMSDRPAQAQQPESVNKRIDYLIDFLAKLAAVLDRVHITVRTGDADASATPAPSLER